MIKRKPQCQSVKEKHCDCGERACPALGCAAALKHSPGAAWHTAAFFLGLLRSPTRGEPARHRE